MTPYDDATHRAFVCSGFLRALRKHEELKQLPSHTFFPVFQGVFDRLSGPSGCRVIVAHVAGRPDDFTGFAIYREHVLWWVYVARPFRRLGLGRMLLDVSGCLSGDTVVAAMRPRDWTYLAAKAHGIKVRHHTGELTNLLACMWFDSVAPKVLIGGMPLSG